MTPGVHIYAGSRELNGLAAALTNPTELARRKGTLQHPYPVTFRDHAYPDAESAYQALKEHAGALRPFTELQSLMVELLIATLTQHPRLVHAVTQHGGTAWLCTCRHQVHARTKSFQRWEGRGEDSAFIRCLMKAYEIVRGDMR